MPSRSRRPPARVCGKEGNGRKHRNRLSAETDRAASAVSVCPRQLLASKNINATVLILRGFLAPAEIKQLRTLGPAGIRVGEDRHPMLSFVHEVWRFERQLEEGDCALFDKLIGAMHGADAGRLTVDCSHSSSHANIYRNIAGRHREPVNNQGQEGGYWARRCG